MQNFTVFCRKSEICWNFSLLLSIFGILWLFMLLYGTLWHFYGTIWHFLAFLACYTVLWRIHFCRNLRTFCLKLSWHKHCSCKWLVFFHVWCQHVFHQLCLLGRVGLVVAMSVCCCRLLVCPLPMRFFFRPLIGPVITWSFRGLSLVSPPPPLYLKFLSLLYHSFLGLNNVKLSTHHLTINRSRSGSMQR